MASLFVSKWSQPFTHTPQLFSPWMDSKDCDDVGTACPPEALHGHFMAPIFGYLPICKRHQSPTLSFDLLWGSLWGCWCQRCLGFTGSIFLTLFEAINKEQMVCSINLQLTASNQSVLNAKFTFPILRRGCATQNKHVSLPHLGR